MVQLLVSFGFRHGKPEDPGASWRYIDIRKLLTRNPWRNKALRKWRGDNPAVIDDIEKTPDLEDSYACLLSMVQRCDDEIVFLGCTGGHHRSVYLANRIGKELGIPVVHRDYYKP